MNLLDNSFYNQYAASLTVDLEQAVKVFCETKFDFGFRMQASSVWSSAIEGNSLTLNSYMNIKMRTLVSQNKEVKEIDDLVDAYNFAKDSPLTEAGFISAHKLLARNLLIKLKHGVYRTEPAGMAGENSIGYQPAEPTRLAGLMSQLFTEIEELLGKDLKICEVFYYAAFMHLRLAHILPFTDGNGRAARLLEKWFLARKLGIQFWNLQVEKQYKDHQQEYYARLYLGASFGELEYSRAVPFLQMLPNSF